ncbi:MAG: hypothetical protein ACI9WU_002773 [Myxococcota bacterium]
MINGPSKHDLYEGVVVLIDMHVHTEYSDEFELTLKDAVTRAREAGLNGLLLAECDVVPPLDEVKAIADEENFPIFIGIDIDCYDGRVILVPRDPTDKRFQTQSWADDDDDFRVVDVVRAGKKMGAIAIAAHPYLDDGGPFLGDRLTRIEGLAGVEVACGVKSFMSNDRALEAASAMALPGVGGSDTGPEGQRLGKFATVFPEDIASQTELVDALEEGLYWAVMLGAAEPRPRQRSGRSGGRSGGGGRGDNRGGGGGGRGDNRGGGGGRGDNRGGGGNRR